MKKILTYLFSLFFVVAYSQEEASNWYFGDGAGIRFNPDGSITELTDGRLNTFEGCTTISDKNGDLLFYTDGITVYNKLHQSMPNANGIGGNRLLGDPSSTQSAIVIPKPQDPNIYYIFTVDTKVSDDDRDPDTGFNYSIVDLTLNGGLGDIVSTSKNINLLQDSSEKISAVLKSCESESVWVITFAPLDGIPGNEFDTFYAYEISNTGLNTTPVISNVVISAFDPRGYLKFSPDGSKLACANAGSGLYLFDFDKTTGKVSNQKQIAINFLPPINKFQIPYGVEFSPNNELLYVSTFFNTRDDNELYSALLQYDLTIADISSSEYILDERDGYRGALQLGPDGKIYKAMSNNYDSPNTTPGIPFLSVVNNPNEVGAAANYQHNAIPLTRNSRQGLPPFITSFFSENIDIIQNDISSTYLPLCLGESYKLISEDITNANYIWTRDGIILSENDFDLEVTQPGFYEVSIESNSANCGTLLGEALVEYFDIPIANQPDDIIICDSDNDGNYNFDFSQQDNIILGSQDPSRYIVSYHLSQNDADLNQNPIFSPYNNGSINPQEIFIRLGINGNTTCYDTSKSFMIRVYNTPIAYSVLNDFIVCDLETVTDLDVTNGQTEINLHLFDLEIFGNQNSTEYSITYYSSISNAENKNAPLNFNYYNQTPFLESIYARIENNLNIDCYDISGPINIVINPLPESINHTIIQCDEDGIVDGFTLFNLNQANTELTGGISGLSTKFFTDSARTLEVDGNAFVNTSNPQTIFVEIINDNTGCFNTAELSLDVSITDSNDVILPAVCDDDGIEDGLHKFNLRNADSDITNGLPAGLNIVYYETYDDALLEQNNLNDTFTNTVPYSQTIYARVENANNCYGISEVVLNVNALPEIDTEDLAYYCLNIFPDTITLNAAVLDNSPSNYTYNWSNGETSYEIGINETGTYNVTVTNTNGCSKERTIMVETSNIATFNLELPYDVNDASQNNTIEIFVSGTGIYEYALYDENNESIYRDFQDSTLFDNVFPGIYTIAVKDVKNDCGTVYNSVSVIGFPKFFTPNNDGFNDTWQVIGVNNMFQPDSKILIFNRFGKLIKELPPLGDGWNGLFNGKKLPSDDYWFSVKLQDGRIFKNHFTLKY